MGNRSPHEIHEAEEAFLDNLRQDLQKQDPIVFDVGANIGSFTEAVLERWPGAIVTAFEPNPEAIDIFKGRHRNRATLIPAALSDTDGTATLFSNGGPDVLASLYQRDLTHKGMKHGTHRTIVPLFTLDKFIEDLGGAEIDLMKLDVEGHELAVLRGGYRRLNCVKLIMFEVNSCNLDSGVSFKDLWDLLDPGFYISQIGPDGKPMPIKSYGPELEDFGADRMFLAVRRVTVVPR